MLPVATLPPVILPPLLFEDDDLVAARLLQHRGRHAGAGHGGRAEAQPALGGAVRLPADPGAPDEQSKKGQILISFGKLFEKVCLSVSCGWMPIVNNVRDCTSVLGSAM